MLVSGWHFHEHMKCRCDRLNGETDAKIACIQYTWLSRKSVKCLSLSSEYCSETVWSCNSGVVWTDKQPIFTHFSKKLYTQSKLPLQVVTKKTVGYSEVNNETLASVVPLLFKNIMKLDDFPAPLEICNFEVKVLTLSKLRPAALSL